MVLKRLIFICSLDFEVEMTHIIQQLRKCSMRFDLEFYVPGKSKNHYPSFDNSLLGNACSALIFIASLTFSNYVL
jgi:hypothetical protein